MPDIYIIKQNEQNWIKEIKKYINIFMEKTKRRELLNHSLLCKILREK